MSNIKVGSFFAGIGGICKGLENAGCEIVVANECDEKACISYKTNHPHINLIQKRIEDVNPTSIPDFDLFAGGFPCQPYSLAGKMGGLTDIRGKLFFDIVEMLKAKSPSIVFLENVANLLNTHDGEDFKVILEHLNNIGYHVKFKVLGGHTHANIPQCRNRLFIVGFKNISHYNNFDFPDQIPLTSTLDQFIDYNSKQDSKYYYTPKSQYYQMMDTAITNKSVYQLRRIYVRENKNNLCPTLTANMGGGGHNVPIIRDAHGIRKLTPNECFKLQGINNFKQVVANAHLYKQAGNSVVQPLITRISTNIIKAIT
jgi:DNA (cytosine-5)-methyltransferase 1